MEYAAEMVDKVLNHNADMVVGDRLSSTYFVLIKSTSTGIKKITEMAARSTASSVKKPNGL